MQGLRHWIPSVMGAGLLMGAVGCQGSDTKGKGPGAGDDNPADVDDLRGQVSAALLRANDCPDLLTKIQADAIMKARLAAYQMKLRLMLNQGEIGEETNNGGVVVDDGSFGGDPDVGGSPVSGGAP